MLHNLTEGMVLVTIILFLFLLNARAALIVACTIPFSLLFASIGLDLSKIPANLLSLGALDFGMVVDAAGLDRFSLLGISRGGSIALAYAVKHPGRVSHLILYGAFAAGLNHVGTPQRKEARRALTSLARLGWGLKNPAFCKMFTCRFIPEATPEHERWFDELQRVSTSPENAARLMERDGEIDVRPLLRQVRVPTLVMHCDRDHVVSPKCGQLLAAEIPGARYVSLPSANHLILEAEPAWPLFLDELGRFLNG